MVKKVNEQSDEVQAMATDWTVLAALMGGTPAMRKAGVKLLPRWPNEEQASYDVRKDVATLFPAYERTLSVMSGKPFSKPLTLSEDTPPEILDLANDIDKEGVNLHTFASEMFEELFYGLAGILVEAPKPIETGSRIATQADQKQAGVRPYWVRIKHDQILGWIVAVVNGSRTLTQLRIAEVGRVPDGPYGETCTERVRVLTPGAWEVYEKQNDKTGKEVWVSIEQGKTELDFIPFVPLYGKRKSFMCGKPPLRELAYLNVKHWQSQSDQDTILHVARVPILFTRLLGDNAITIGGSTAVKSDDEHADMKWVEHTGKAIEAGAKSLSDLEAQMIQTGAELMVARPGRRTATEDANDSEGNKCELQKMTEGFEDALDLALQYTAKYIGLDSGGNVSLFKDFAAFWLTDASAQIVNAMQTQGLISKVTTIKEQQRRGNLSPDIDPQEELDAVMQEGPAPGTLIDNSQGGGSGNGA